MSRGCDHIPEWAYAGRLPSSATAASLATWALEIGQVLTEASEEPGRAPPVLSLILGCDSELEEAAGRSARAIISCHACSLKAPIMA